MFWKGVELKTIGDLLNDGVLKCDTPEEAQTFMQQLRLEDKYADENIGYLTGYCDPDTMTRIQSWFGVAHPIFGTSTLTPEEAFNAGQEWAKNNRS